MVIDRLTTVFLTVSSTLAALWLFNQFTDPKACYIPYVTRNPARNPGSRLLNWEQSAALVREQLTALAEADAVAGWHALAPTSGRIPAAATNATSAGVGTGRRLRSNTSQLFRGLLADGQPIPAAANESPAANGRGNTLVKGGSDSAVEGLMRSVDESAAAAAAGTEGSRKNSLPTALLAVTTANVWDKTDKMLQSIALCRDRFELLVIDERSTDATQEALKAMGITAMESPAIQGVTANWNMMYRRWRKSSHEFLFIINNDVLVPDGVITRLMHTMSAAGSDCTLTAPISTIRGKGYWGSREGLEVLYGLSPDSAAAAFVNNPYNYGRLQDVLDALPAAEGALVMDTAQGHNDGFSGFFFGMRRSIEEAAFSKTAGLLFDPKNIILHQESDLWHRITKQGGMKVCLDAGSFVYHYKGSTVGTSGGNNRENFRAPGR